MQQSAAREFMISPQIDEAYEQFKTTIVSSITAAVPITRKGAKFQEPIPEETPFPCDTSPGSPGAPSPTRPTSVHKLRPGDINVVGAMGDSITAASGAASVNLLQGLIENRGLSFAIGGEATWRKYLTLPNILKEFNPKLVGFSVGDSLGFMKDAKFNVAEPIAMNKDMMFQAQLLTRRMKADKNVDFCNDWKLVTILVGHNDFCSEICYVNRATVTGNIRAQLEAALNYLQDNMPRVLINLLLPLDVTIYKSFATAIPACQIYYRFACSCFFGPSGGHHHQELHEIIKKTQQIYFKIVKNDRYAEKDEFAVVLQPFLYNATFRYKTVSHKNVTDLSEFAADCFHPSQKGHALMANSLWNSMLEPVGKKTFNTAPGVLERFLCPTADQPYIFTAKNSH
ncbi:hypothetical protein Cfor_01196 [Coptotermes formosanus]|uniref:Phospholipase B1, membrane-associated n=1 Tax=Coptotermes formosanus TaxID=36987 RepID=A0A6L2Q173_COPFO|nr:hypothetical protein Cfor_01196 [Coptotermes formosanus]